jgi:hypothetical protein
MNLKPGILSLLIGTVLFSAGAASADGRDGHRRDRDDDREHRAGRPSLISVHVHGPGCHHAPAPAPRPNGRYELRTTQRWVQGYEERVWVPEVCHTKEKRHSRKTVCRGGYYDTRHVAGYYEPVEEWVWVPVMYREHEHHEHREYPERRGPNIQVTARF